MESTFWLLATIILCFAIFGNMKRDDSDGKERSGLIVYTDNKTGCQYLGTITGAITPRLGRDGKIVCIKE